MADSSHPVPKLEHTTLTDSSQINLWSVDKECRYTFFNDRHKNDMKSVWGADIQIGQYVLDYITDAEYKTQVAANYKKLLAGEAHRSKDRFTLATGESVYYENFGQAIRDTSGKIIGIMFYTVNITQKTDMEDKLKLSISLLKSIMNSPDDIHILSIDRQYRYLFFNNAHSRGMRNVWSSEPEIGKDVLKMLPDSERRKTTKAFYDRALKGEIVRQNSEFTDKYGNKKYYDNISAPIHNADGEITGITVFTIDITDKEKAVEQINRSLEEKEFLLREIHHRVKNNLQIISSIINLQLNQEEDGRITTVLTDSLNRLSTMSNIHQMLYQGSDLARINMKSYCMKLVDSIMELSAQPHDNITLDIQVESIELELDQAIPMGLIINELVTNSLKYAFDSSETGKISVLIRKYKDEIHLRVSDTGRGLSEDKIENSGSLGLELIKVFTEQLKGRVEFVSDNGLTADVYF